MNVPSLGRVARGVRRRLGPQSTTYEGQLLPPPHMRYCGAEFRDDAVFLSSGRDEARRLTDSFGLSSDTRLLEIGCGPGRLPIGLLAECGEIMRYDGVDVDSAAVTWCRRHLTKHHPMFRFHHVDAQNDRYNPDGKEMADGFRLPFTDDSYDIIYLHSVFTNMVDKDVRVYCQEFHRLVHPQGRVFLTGFIEESVPPITVNPEDYHIPSTGPLNVVRYQKEFFLGLLRESGFEIDHFSYATELGGQSAVRLRPSAP